MDTVFFGLSKIAWALLSPSNVMVILMVSGTLFLVFNRFVWAKRILIPTSVLAFIVMAYPVSDFLMQPLESRFEQPSIANNLLPKKIDGIIVLGGGEDLKRSLSWNRPELGLGGDRYIGAKELANHYPNAPVIFTGGSGSLQLQNTDGEGSLAKRLLLTLGINEERLIIESKSRNTYENFKLVKPLLPTFTKQHPETVTGTYLLVTSAFHMPRSVGIARKQGVNVIAYPVDFRSQSNALRKIDFDLFDHLKSLEPAWKEWIGLSVYYWTNKTNNWFPKPE